MRNPIRTSGGRLVLSLVVILGLFLGSTWLAPTPKVLSFPHIDGTTFLNSEGSNPLLFEGATLSPTLTLANLQQYLGLPPGSSPAAIDGTTIDGATVILAKDRTGAIGNVNFLDQSELVASQHAFAAASGSLTAAQTYASHVGAWIVTDSRGSGVRATYIANLPAAVNGIESGTISSLPTPTQLPGGLVTQASRNGAVAIGGLTFKEGQIAASTNDLWVVGRVGSNVGLFRDNGTKTVFLPAAQLPHGSVLSATPTLPCVVAASSAGIQSFSEKQSMAAPSVTRRSLSAPLAGTITPLSGSGATVSFAYQSRTRTTVVSAVVSADCSLRKTTEVSVGPLRLPIVNGWQWNGNAVLEFSRPQMAFGIFSEATGQAVSISTPGHPRTKSAPISLRSGVGGTRFNTQFGGFSGGFAVDDPASPYVAIGRQESNAVVVTWLKRSAVFSFSAQASNVSSSVKTHTVASKSTVVVLQPTSACDKVEPTQQINGLQLVSVLATSAVIQFEAPSTVACTSNSFKVFVRPYTGGAEISEDCQSVVPASDNTLQCSVVGLTKSTHYDVSVAAEWGPENQVALATKSTPILVTTISVNLKDPTSVSATYAAAAESWHVNWSGGSGPAIAWKVTVGVCLGQTITPFSSPFTFVSRTNGALVIPLSATPALFGQNVQFEVAPGLISNGQIDYAPATPWTACQWTPPSKSCFDSANLAISGSVPQSSTGAEATVNVTTTVGAKCYLGQAELFYQYAVTGLATPHFQDCVANPAWQPTYSNAAHNYPGSCLVNTSAAQINAGTSIVRIRYVIFLPNGLVYQDHSPGQSVAGGSLTHFAWPKSGSVTAGFSYVAGSAKNVDALPSIAIALNGLVTPGEQAPSFSVPPQGFTMSCGGADGNGSQVQIGSLTRYFSVANGVPTVTFGDGGGNNYDLIQAAGGYCTVNLSLSIPTVTGGVSTNQVLTGIPVSIQGPLVMDQSFPPPPVAGWFGLCTTGTQIVLSMSPQSPCSPSGLNAPGAINGTAGNTVQVSYAGQSYLATPVSGFWQGTGAPPESYTFNSPVPLPAAGVSLTFTWTYLNTNYSVTVSD